MTNWDDVQAARDKADEWVAKAATPPPPNIPDPGTMFAVLAVQAEIRALELTLDMKLTAYPDSEATLGFGG